MTTFPNSPRLVKGAIVGEGTPARNLSGKMNARMGTAGFLPQGSKLHEVFPIKCQDGSVLAAGKRQLFIVRDAKLSCGAGRETIDRVHRAYSNSGSGLALIDTLT